MQLRLKITRGGLGMSFMYKIVERIIVSISKSSFGLSGKQKLWLFLFFSGLVPILVNIIVLESPITNLLLWWVLFFIGIALLALSGYKLIKSEKAKTEDEYRAIIDDVSKRIIEVGLNTQDKIHTLMAEIQSMIEEDDAWLTKTRNTISKTFWFIFWVPLGTMVGMWFNRGLELEDTLPDPEIIATFGISLFTIASTAVGFLLILNFVFDTVFQTDRTRRKLVYKYLRDVLYFKRL